MSHRSSPSFARGGAPASITPAPARPALSVAPLTAEPDEEPDDETKDRHMCMQCGGQGQDIRGVACFWCEGRGYRL